MLRKGKRFKTAAGYTIQVQGFLAEGGQAHVYICKNLETGEIGAFKKFKPDVNRRDSEKRIRFLIAQELSRACSVICSPIDLILTSDTVGHYSPLAEGSPAEEVLAGEPGAYTGNLALAFALAYAVDVLEQRGIANGDLHPGNLLVNKRGSLMEIRMIDLDNFWAAGVPEPPMIGLGPYLAPELRENLKHGRLAVPDIRSDRFALFEILHEILLLKHSAQGFDDEESFEKVMLSGKWAHDPAGPSDVWKKVDGYPPTVLNADLQRLFRRGASRNREDRPTAGEWKMALDNAQHQLDVCEVCGATCIVDCSKAACPVCRTPYRPYLLILPNGTRILVNQGMMLGRNDLGGSPNVSERHAIFRRHGPWAFIESRGRNGLYRSNGSEWKRLPDEKAILLQRGDRLKLADVEMRVE